MQIALRLFLILIVAGISPALASEPHKKIDRLIRAGWADRGIQPAGRATDRVWCRRVYLDLVGRIPTVGELGRFLGDERGDKRQHLVDVLLQSEDYVQHFSDVFDVLLMGRTNEQNYSERTKHHWRAYIERTFRENRPWNDVVSEILLGRPKGNEDRGAAWFLFERKNDHQKLAESVAPAVFGVHIECAQCHDHMSVDEIKQAHYWGLVAFFNRSKNQHTKNGPRVAESAIGGFSDFADIHGSSSPNLLTFLEAGVVDEPRPDKDSKQKDRDDLYVRSPVENEPRVPKFSRRSMLVDRVVNQHPRIARAFVNRIWAMLMGRGIVHPFDKMDSMHPPSHPELLDWLAGGFEYSEFDIKKLVRMIVLSEPYQLSSVRPDGLEDPASFAWYLERPLTAEQMSRSIQLALRGEFDNHHDLVKQLRQKFRDVMPEQHVSTVNDALFLANNDHVDRFIRESSQEQQLIGRMTRAKSRERMIDIAYQSLFGRSAGEQEAIAIDEYLDARKQDSTALQQIVWAIVTSAEFRFNH